MKTVKNLIFIEPQGGLGNRMRVIASGIWLRDQLKASLVVIWNQNDELNCPFAALFEALPMALVIKKPAYYRYLRRTNGPGGYSDYTSRLLNRLAGIDYYITEPDFPELIWTKKIDLLHIARNHKRLYIQTCQEFGDNLYAFRIFKPVPLVRERIKTITNTFGDHAVGVHIRRTDNAYASEQSPLELFTEAMKDAAQAKHQSLFYLSSDDQLTKKKLLNIFGNRVITGSHAADRKTLSGLQDALTDLYCLAATQYVIGSYWSSFSDIAARIGGIELKIMKKSI